MRLAESHKLAEELLTGITQLTPAKIGDAIYAGKEQWLILDKPVPVSISDVATCVNKEAELNFWENMYR